MRLAQGQVRPVVADRPVGAGRASEPARFAEIEAGDGSDAEDEQARHRAAEGGFRGLAAHFSDLPKEMHAEAILSRGRLTLVPAGTHFVPTVTSSNSCVMLA